MRASAVEPASPSFTDRPFGCPPDIVLDLPAPPSVNKTRRVNWAARAGCIRWMQVADMAVLHWRSVRKEKWVIAQRIKKFELHIVLSEKHCRGDLDNLAKQLIDYLRRIELIEDDSRSHMRRLTLEWGDAPEGARVTVRAIG